MHRIDAAGYAPGNLFTDGNPATATAATVVDAAWLNDVQENIVGVIAAAGIALTKGDYTQLLAALRSTGVHQTPAQFDNTTKAATTEFVQRALGSIAGVRAINAVTTLTAADAGKEIALFGSAGFTLTLPLGSAVAVGTCLYFSSSMTAGNVALVRQGADTISVGTNSLNGITIYPGSTLTLKWNGAAWVASGESQLPYSPLFAFSVGSTSGYYKLPSGVIVQYGLATVTTGTPLAQTFPIAFPTAVRSLTLGTNAPSGAGNTAFTSGNSTSGFSMNVNGTAGTTNVFWQAMGY